MGYSTRFQGELRFTVAPTAEQLVHLNAIFGEHPNHHPEWDVSRTAEIGYIDLELTRDLGGIKWSGAEKTYGMVGAVTLVVAEMRKRWPDFGLKGTLQAQGEDIEDRWTLAIGDNGHAVKIVTDMSGKIVRCPECRHRFLLDETKE